MSPLPIDVVGGTSDLPSIVAWKFNIAAEAADRQLTARTAARIDVRNMNPPLLRLST
jgi:hypothetical protein